MRKGLLRANEVVRNRWFAPVAITLAGVLMAAAALALRPHFTAAPPTPQDTRPINVLLITLDTTRADRLGCYGYKTARTPALDALARQGIRFTQAFTQVPLTLPSHTTIMTGLHPPEHGLHDNGREKLGPAPRTLVEVFAEQHYQTAAFLASYVLDKQFGLDRGFDVYDDRMTAGTDTDNVFDAENPGNVVADRALEWLGQNGDRPFFCWVHFFDAHLPYAPPEPFKSEIADPYDGEIAFMDSQVRRLVAFLESRGLRERTLIVVCGDHGESFGEHQEQGHGGLVYNTTMHVPLTLTLPGRLPQGRVVDRVVGLVDVARTVMDVLGWPRPEEMSGRSLLAEDVPANRACFGESEFLFNSQGWAPLYSLTNRHWKYIDCPRPELYDRLADANEAKNVAEDRPQIVAELHAQLHALRTVLQKGRGAEIELNEEEITKLRQLGYLGGTVTLPKGADPSTLKDPKAMMEVYNACRAARELIEKDQPRQAVDLIEPLLARSPDSPEMHDLLAQGYVAFGEYAEARPHVEACLKADPANRPMLANLGVICREAGETEAAVRAFRAGLQATPKPGESAGRGGVSKVTVRLRCGLGAALAGQNQLDAAAEQYEFALKGDPELVEAHAGLAAAYERQGKDKDAMRHYQRVLALSPGSYNATVHLGLLLWKEKSYAEAAGLWRAGLKSRENDPILMYNVAWGLATCPDSKCRNGREAVTVAELYCRATDWADAKALDTLAAAYAEAGDFRKAVDMARNALTAAKAQTGGAELVKEIERRLILYRGSKPYRQ